MIPNLSVSLTFNQRKRDMRDEERINPGHDGIRQAARVIGPLMIAVGGMFTAIGMISFFSSFGSFEPPQYFWCAFIGLPLMAFGGAVTKFAYLGAIFRYLAGEVAPVQKDTFNYLATGVSPGVKDLARAVSEGLAEGRQVPHSDDSKYCSHCGQAIALDANFCSSCGQKVV